MCSMQKQKSEHLNERLLDIREAAEFLHVSEMSIRRWTNSGALKCYRLGGKRERRFHMRDMEEFLQGSRTDRLKALGVGGFRVPDGSHMTHFYSGKEEALGVSTSYVIEGLRRGERVLAVMPPERAGELMKNLKRLGRSAERGIESGRLLLSEGMDSPKEMIRYLTGFTEEPGSFRLVGDGAWTLRKNWDLVALKALEEAGNFRDSRKGSLFLCQYSLEDFSGAHIMMAAELHSHVIYKGRLEKSLYSHRK